MKNLPSREQPLAVGKSNSVLADWLKATARLYSYYQQFANYIHQREREQVLQVGATTDTDQYPLKQLLKFVCTMQNELIRLTQDMNIVDKGQPSTRLYSKLAKHTQRLNHLNHQAHTKLDLIHHTT